MSNTTVEPIEMELSESINGLPFQCVDAVTYLRLTGRFNPDDKHDRIGYDKENHCLRFWEIGSDEPFEYPLPESIQVRKIDIRYIDESDNVARPYEGLRGYYLMTQDKAVLVDRLVEQSRKAFDEIHSVVCNRHLIGDNEVNPFYCYQ